MQNGIYSTGGFILFAGYFLGMLVWIYVAYKHKPGKAVIAKLPKSVRWTLFIPFMEIWRDHLDAADQTRIERYLIFSHCMLIYFSLGLLILLFLSLMSAYPLIIL